MWKGSPICLLKFSLSVVSGELHGFCFQNTHQGIGVFDQQANEDRIHLSKGKHHLASSEQIPSYLDFSLFFLILAFYQPITAQK